MRYSESPQLPTPPHQAGFEREDVQRVEMMVSAGWTWVEAVEAVAQDSPAARDGAVPRVD
jgi:hypothetical protein